MTACLSCHCDDKPIQARGLCGICYHRHKTDGTLDRFASKRRPHGVILEEHAFLSGMGVPDERIAEQLGITYDSLRTVLTRHRRKVGA